MDYIILSHNYLQENLVLFLIVAFKLIVLKYVEMEPGKCCVYLIFY